MWIVWYLFSYTFCYFQFLFYINFAHDSFLKHFNLNLS